MAQICNIMTNPKLSIIIATYNCQENIKNSLSHISNQKYEDWECIIVDGLSEDSTIDIVARCIEKDSRIRYISEKDNGIYDAFNKGWKLAKGTWIYYIGSDDIITDDGLYALMKCAGEVGSNVGMINGGVIRISQDGMKKIIMSERFVGSHQGMIMRRDAIKELNGFNEDYKVIADYDLFIRMKNSHWDVFNTDAIVAYFSAGGTSESFSATITVFREKLRILKNDKMCKHPFAITLFDTSKTIFGGFIHKGLKVLLKL